MQGSSVTIRDNLAGTVRDYQNEAADMMYNDVPALRWAANHHVNTRREPMGFRQMPYLFQLYYLIGDTPNMVVEKSVQCGLSELFIIQSHIEAGERGLSVMYVLPKYELRNRFVNNRIDKLHKTVPHYTDLVESAPTTVHRVSLMHFGRGTLIYVGSNVADEFIEVPIDAGYIDEKDRCNQANLLYLPDRYTASPYRYHREISNPTVEGFGIDERYQESSQGEWQIECEYCNKWFTPDFWAHLVRRTGETTFEALDPDYAPGEEDDARLVHTCGHAIDRLKPGRWEHKHPKRFWKGFRVSKLFSKFARMGELIDKWNKAQGNELKTQIVYNSDLGLPYSSKGAKITREALNDCRRPYRWPVQRVAQEYARTMGVDVGSMLHVIIRERIPVLNFDEEQEWSSRLILAVAVNGFSDVARLIKEWRPKVVVIDALPEIHKVSELKGDFKQVWSSRFQEVNVEMSVDRKKREVRMNRTALLDSVQQDVNGQVLLLPMQADTIEDYYPHMMASTRILEADETNPEKSRFVWRETRPDHYFLAEGYCKQADMMLPDHSVFEYYKEAGSKTAELYNRKRIKSGETVEERQHIADMKRITPELHLSRLQANYVEPIKVKPPVDDEEIWIQSEIMLAAQGFVDVYTIAKQVNEHEDDVKRVLKIHGLGESRIQGQYIR